MSFSSLSVAGAVPSIRTQRGVGSQFCEPKCCWATFCFLVLKFLYFTAHNFSIHGWWGRWEPDSTSKFSTFISHSKLRLQIFQINIITRAPVQLISQFNQTPSINIMIDLRYVSLDQWDKKIHLLWGKCFNIQYSIFNMPGPWNQFWYS